MKTIYKSTLLLALACFTLAMNAQKDTTLNRQVMLERDYTPTLKDASKINTTPAIYEPTMVKKDVRFLDHTPQISLASNILGTAKSGDIKTGVDFDKKRGYLGLGAGSNSNIEGVLGIRVLNGRNDQLDIFANHSSTSGNVDYLEKIFWLKEAKAKYSDTKVNLNYAHTFEPSILSFRTSFFNTSYNYYGNSFIERPVDETLPYPFDLDGRQNVDVFALGAGLRSTDNNTGLLRYMLSLDYRNLQNKYSPRVNDKGIKGGQFDLGVDLSTEFDSDKTIGIKGDLMNQSIRDIKFPVMNDAFHSFTNITVSPYFNFIGESWDASLGLNINSMFDVKTKFLVSPNLSAGINVTEDSRFYASIGGGINNNTMLDILQENRYVDPVARIAYSKTIYDAIIGFKSGALTGFEFDVFGGYKQTKNDHLYVTTANGFYSWGNVGTPLYTDVSTGHAGGLIKTNLIPYTELSAKATGYFYTVKYQSGTFPLFDEKKAWGRPSFTAELNADVKVIPQFTFSLNYLYAGGRKAFRDILGKQSSVKMKDINELNLRAEYQITSWAAVNVRANNILFQKYERIDGYALQGGNFMGGLNFKF